MNSSISSFASSKINAASLISCTSFLISPGGTADGDDSAFSNSSNALHFSMTIPVVLNFTSSGNCTSSSCCSESPEGFASSLKSSARLSIITATASAAFVLLVCVSRCRPSTPSTSCATAIHSSTQYLLLCSARLATANRSSLPCRAGVCVSRYCATSKPSSAPSSRRQPATAASVAAVDAWRCASALMVGEKRARPALVDWRRMLAIVRARSSVGEEEEVLRKVSRACSRMVRVMSAVSCKIDDAIFSSFSSAFVVW
ncbi:hypothetical protein BZA70DRAFT_281284 [Myxozyma melibiosi]|uniref:Uncharacterized protein n=1 Tax=Myxozyma melibiosi TaxID=54550 RepID=A0ABR1F2D4_9ASCO